MTIAKTWQQIMADENEKDEMRYELAQQMRQSFMAKYPTGRDFFFAYSLVTARWGDCQKDIKRGRVTRERAAEIVSDAIQHHILSVDFAEMCGLPVK